MKFKLASLGTVCKSVYREGYNLVLTGSNAHLLSKELATTLPAGICR